MEQNTAKKLKLLWLLIAGPVIPFHAYALEGYNFGAGLGFETLRADIQSNYQLNAITATNSGMVYQYAGIGNIFGGYGLTVGEWFYIGAELGVNIVSNNTATLNNNNQSKAIAPGTDVTTGVGAVAVTENLQTKIIIRRNSVEPTLDFKPGVLVTPRLLAYGRLGVAVNRVSATAEATSAAIGAQDVTVFGFNLQLDSGAKTAQQFKKSADSTIIGWRTGFGVTGLLNSNFGFSADYIYTFYNTQTINQTANANAVVCDFIEGCSVTPNGRYHNRTSARINDQQVMLSLIYYLQNTCI